MTLLEAIVATVVLSAVAVACLEGTRGAAALQSRAADASTSVALAEAALAETAVGAPLSTDLVRSGVRITRRPYPHASRLDVVTVEVPRVGAAPFRLSRLVPTPESSMRSAMSADGR